VADELGNGPGRQLGINRHDERNAFDAGDRSDIPHQIEIEIGVERRAYRGWRANEKKRVPVGARMSDGIGSDVGAGARPVLDDELLAEPLG